MIVELCHICKAGPTGYDEYRNVYNDINELTSKEKNMLEKKTKICRKCGAEKGIDEYAKHPECKDGHEGQCRECRKKQNKARAEKRKAGTYKVPPSGTKIKKRKLKPKKNAENSTEIKADAIVLDEIAPLPALDIMQLEKENDKAMTEAARLIIATVKKDLLGAVFTELRNK